MYKKILDQLPLGVKLVTVSKTKSVDDVLRVYNEGQRTFGENRCEEMAEKFAKLPQDIEWHMIGHLQSKKVKKIVSFVSLIHSVDSLKLLEVIDKEAKRHDRVIDCLLQIKIGQEDAKTGLSIKEAEDILTFFFLSSRTRSEATQIRDPLSNTRIIGIMGMATFIDDEEIVRAEFRQLKKYFDYLKEKYFKNDNGFKEISAGMSGDYKIAIEEGSTMVRVGGLIFGNRK